MSVAFRRDSDEEHLEPKFERPIPPGPNLVTPRGLALIRDRVGALQAAIAVAPDAEREPLRRELRYWNTRHATAELAPPPSDGEVGIGSHVVFTLAGSERAAEIVGTDEADPATGRIGFQAPLARALLGALAGERVDFNGKAEAIAIVRIGRGPATAAGEADG
jgi:transcription elongation GreA/GreB family factor